MRNNMARSFEDRPAVRERVPLLLGIVGPSSSGKTFSALRLATGMQKVIGGEIFFIDTEARRGAHYADRFKFRHVDFQPPFGPLDYLAAIEHCISKGAKILIIDSMTHEHSGPGGVMDQSEQMLEKKCGDDWKARDKNLMLSLVKPKAQRKKLNAAIVQLGINAIMCYRAQDKIKPVRGGEPLKLGWQPETTSPLHYDMTVRFLLPPGCDGYPQFLPETDTEKLMVKMPDQFRELLKGKMQLSEDVGQKLAEWAAGSVTPRKPLTGEKELLAATTEAELTDAWKKTKWANDAEKQELTAIAAKRKAEIQANAAPPDEPSDEPEKIFYPPEATEKKPKTKGKNGQQTMVDTGDELDAQAR